MLQQLIHVSDSTLLYLLILIIRTNTSRLSNILPSEQGVKMGIADDNLNTALTSKE